MTKKQREAAAAYERLDAVARRTEAYFDRAATTANRWDELWTNYIDALTAWDDVPAGEDFVSWAGVAGRRLDEAKRALRIADRDFCDRLGI
jgi:hypothetical protein